MNTRIPFYKRIPHDQKGFTFVEFVVILSIFAIITGISLFNFQGFTRNTTIQNLSQDVALQIKAAQTLGVSAVGDNTLSTNLRQIVSVTFEHDDNGIFKRVFNTYRELDTGEPSDSGIYSQDEDILIQQSNLAGGFINYVEICQANNCEQISSNVSVSFQRPDPEPIITSQDCSYESSDEFAYGQCRGSLKIHIVANRDRSLVQVVVIEPSGQIRVEPLVVE